MKQTVTNMFYQFKRMQWYQFWFFMQNNKDVLLFSHQTSSMKHHLTETHEQNFETHNIVLSSQSISLTWSRMNDNL